MSPVTYTFADTQRAQTRACFPRHCHGCWLSWMRSTWATTSTRYEMKPLLLASPWCGAVCCSVCVSVCVLQCFAVCCSVLQCVAVCGCRVSQCLYALRNEAFAPCFAVVCCIVLHCAVVRCSVLQCVAVLQCAPVCRGTMQFSQDLLRRILFVAADFFEPIESCHIHERATAYKRPIHVTHLNLQIAQISLRRVLLS